MDLSYRHLAFFGLTMTSVIATACGSSSSSPAVKRIESQRARQRMHENFALVDKMRDAVVRGELHNAQAAAGELGGRLKSEDYPADWAPHLQPVRRAVWGTHGAKQLTEAAEQTARAGRACGACHEELGAVVELAATEPLDKSATDLAGFMHRHRWAAERLWVGIIGPSDQAWMEGVEAMEATAPANAPERVQAVAGRLAEISASARAQSDLDGRASAFGQYLGACATCHRAYLDAVD